MDKTPNHIKLASRDFSSACQVESTHSLFFLVLLLLVCRLYLALLRLVAGADADRSQQKAHADEKAEDLPTPVLNRTTLKPKP